MNKATRNVTMLSTAGIAKGTEEIEQKAKAEVAKATPESKKAKDILLNNVLEDVEVKTEKSKK
jgi:hypothetical protein